MIVQRANTLEKYLSAGKSHPPETVIAGENQRYKNKNDAA